jgi:hypothetical protein
MSSAAARSGDLSDAAYAGTSGWHVVLTEPGAARGLARAPPSFTIEL